MRANKRSVENSEIVLLVQNNTSKKNYLDSTQSLTLAVLGAISIQITPIERLIQTVWALMDGGWKPPVEVISGTLKLQVELGHIVETESWVQSVPFLYGLTPKGAEEFQILIRKPLPTCVDPISSSSAAIKYGLLDLLENEDLHLVAEDLDRFFKAMRASLKDRLGVIRNDRPFIYGAVGERITSVDKRLSTINRLIKSQARRKLVP